MNPIRAAIADDWLKLLRSFYSLSTPEVEAATQRFLDGLKSRRGEAPPSMGAAEAVAQIESGDTVFIGAGLCAPPDLIAALAARGPELERVRLQIIGMATDSPLFEESLQGHLRFSSFFVDSSTLRELIATGKADYVPTRLSELFSIAHPHNPADCCLIRTSAPDADGMLSLSSNAGLNMGKMLASRKVFAEIDPGLVPMPGFTRVPLAAFDGVVASSQTFQPAREVSAPLSPDPVYGPIAAYTAEKVEDGATIQIGVGRFLPHLVEELTQKKHLGLHASFMTHGILRLIQQGVIDNSEKGCFDGISIVGSAALTQDLIAFNEAHGSIHFFPMEFFAHVSILSRHRRFLSITGALEVDLTGQVGADSLGNKIYSGLGAQQDFILGAQLSPEGKTLILLPAMLNDGSLSRICLTKQEGSGQTCSRGDVDFVVTEHGVCEVKGRSIAERALGLIQLAAPSFRESLHKDFFFVGRSDAYYT